MEKTRKSLVQSYSRTDWPSRSGKFTIYPELGKERAKGNGVTPIKLGPMEELARQGWKLELPFDIAILKRPGNLDAGWISPGES